MRVAHLDTESTWRGGEAQVLHLASGLKKRGIETLLITQPGAALATRGAGSGLMVRACRMRGEWDLFAARRLARVLKAEQVDVLHMHTAHAVTLGALAARWAGVPVRVATRRVDFKPRRGFFTRKRYVKGLDTVVCISEGVRQVMLEAGVPEDHLLTIYSAVDSARFAHIDREAFRQELGLTAEVPLLVNVGALTDHKGQKFLIDAMPKVLEVFADTHLAIAGEGELHGPLEQQIRELGLQERVHLLGFRDDIPNIIAAADVFVLPSHLEGLCTSLLDAMAVGVPVVGTEVGGIPEVIYNGRNGFLVPPRDPDALSGAICLMLDNGPIRTRMIQKATEQLHTKFSMETMIDRYVGLYQNLLREKRHQEAAILSAPGSSDSNV